MVGICGVAGNTEFNINGMVEKLFFLGSEKSTTYSNTNLNISTVFLKEYDSEQPVINQDGSYIWIWGDIYGYQGSRGYSSKQERDVSDVEYCSDLYNRYGLKFIDGLNGEFAGIIYDKNKQKIHLITDRLGTHPLFFIKTSDGLVFSTNIQSIPFYPSVNTEFDLKYVYHFLAYERVLGTKTVLKDVEKVHPGSILSYDLRSNKAKTITYWMPRYKPKPRPYPDIVNEFTLLFKQVMQERIRDDLRYGLYLSGGSDSRLILSVLDDLYPDIDVTCYHINELMNREAKVSKKVSQVCNYKFKYLFRDHGYLEKILQETSPISIYNSWFDHSHFIGFKNEISRDVDTVIHGNFSDTILKRHHIPEKIITLPFLKRKIYLPSFLEIKTPEDFLKRYVKTKKPYGRDGKIPTYVKCLNQKILYDSLKDEYKKVDGSVIFHGVKYPSFDDFLHWWAFYPLTNTKSYLGYYSEIQMHRSFTPFLDNRMIDFSLSLPDNMISKKDFVNSAIKNINPSLTEIPHAETNVPIKYPKLIYTILSQSGITRLGSLSDSKVQGPWGDPSQILRDHSFVKERILSNKSLIEQSDFLDWKAIQRVYSEHIEGEDNTNQLLGLLTFLGNPLTKHLIALDKEQK